MPSRPDMVQPLKGEADARVIARRNSGWSPRRRLGKGCDVHRHAAVELAVIAHEHRLVTRTARELLKGSVRAGYRRYAPTRRIFRRTGWRSANCRYLCREGLADPGSRRIRATRVARASDAELGGVGADDQPADRQVAGIGDGEQFLAKGLTMKSLTVYGTPPPTGSWSASDTIRATGLPPLAVSVAGRSVPMSVLGAKSPIAGRVSVLYAAKARPELGREVQLGVQVGQEVAVGRTPVDRYRRPVVGEDAGIGRRIARTGSRSPATVPPDRHPHSWRTPFRARGPRLLGHRIAIGAREDRRRRAHWLAPGTIERGPPPPRWSGS
ncbi:unnamed protein product [Acanthosepion pharaonis]|uniref:Uncharacterized protein n=1 Tax=Acanthosepion pharaonis TaxID=158019 RepID=A0A812DJ92_ACAPH|nr:unnamed protein product [Sepia pharaonis]